MQIQQRATRVAGHWGMGQARRGWEIRELLHVEKRRFRAVTGIISLTGEDGEGAASSSGRCKGQRERQQMQIAARQIPVRHKGKQGMNVTVRVVKLRYGVRQEDDVSVSTDTQSAGCSPEQHCAAGPALSRGLHQTLQKSLQRQIIL